MKVFDIDNYPMIGGVIASNKIIKDGLPVRLVFREKPISVNDSGWRLYSGKESEEYSNNVDNFSVVMPQQVFEVDASCSQLLLYKGIGSAWQLNDNDEWYAVTHVSLAGDELISEQITDKWAFQINNLFMKSTKDDDLMYTSVDKTVRISNFKYNGDDDGAMQAQIYANEKLKIEAKRHEVDIIELYEFQQDNLKQIGYHIKEYDEEKQYEYNLVCAFNFAESEVLYTFFYFDDDKDIDWCLQTWQSISYG